MAVIRRQKLLEAAFDPLAGQAGGGAGPGG